MIESGEIPDVTDNIDVSSSTFSPYIAELAESVSLKNLHKESQYHSKY